MWSCPASYITPPVPMFCWQSLLPTLSSLLRPPIMCCSIEKPPDSKSHPQCEFTSARDGRIKSVASGASLTQIGAKFKPASVWRLISKTRKAAKSCDFAALHSLHLQLIRSRFVLVGPSFWRRRGCWSRRAWQGRGPCLRRRRSRLRLGRRARRVPILWPGSRWC